LNVVPKIIDETKVVFWFRRDLRLDDNAGLYHALQNPQPVVPIFIFDAVILDQLENTADARVDFIHQSLTLLNEQLHTIGTTLVVMQGDPVEIFSSLTAASVHANDDYEPYARQRDKKVEALLRTRGIPFHTYKDHVIFEKNEIVKEDGSPYTVFTPYSRKWKGALNSTDVKSFSIDKRKAHFAAIDAQRIPSPESIGFRPGRIQFPRRIIRSSVIGKYDVTRDFPALDGTTRLSVHLRFGTVSIRKLVRLAMSKNDEWLNELVWRDFYQMILYHFPHVVNRSFKPQYDNIEWRNDEHEFSLWCEGKTGFPLVDAGMRELNETGFMHNRVRMVTAGFLVKHLLIDWRWGEAYFAKKLLDFELASNNGGWQWAAGSGCDAAPYFRVFNPELQQKKFDPEFVYCKKWIPELETPGYARPMVNHAVARERALQVYQKALRQR
jgi:deoxyribodipyrimidine photo-lyase